MTPESEIREALDEIMGRLEMRGGSSRLKALIERIMDDLVNTIFDWLAIDNVTDAHRDLATLVIILAILALIGLGIFLAFRIRVNIRKRRMAIQDDIGFTPDEWFTRYQQALNQGDIQEAFRCAWRRTLAELTAKDRVVERRGLTTGEAVKEAKLMDPAFASFTQRFEQAIYANRRAVQEDIVQAELWRAAIHREAGIRP